MSRKTVRGAALGIPKGWADIARKPKVLFGWPSWSEVEPLVSSPRVKTRRGQVHTVSNELTTAVTLLAPAGSSSSMEGVRLRLKAWAYRRHEDVTATLEVEGGRNFVTIARVDAWPTTVHANSWKVLTKPGLKGLPAEIDSCHVHRFGDNAKYGSEAFWPGPEGNLPVAVPLPNNLNSFRDFLRAVGNEFNIDGLDDVEGPPTWQVIL